MFSDAACRGRDSPRQVGERFFPDGTVSNVCKYCIGRGFAGNLQLLKDWPGRAV